MEKCEFCEGVRAWFSRPFNEDGDVKDWFLFVGFIAVASWIWSRILERILR